MKRINPGNALTQGATLKANREDPKDREEFSYLFL
jgi:hypothetical protein